MAMRGKLQTARADGQKNQFRIRDGLRLVKIFRNGTVKKPKRLMAGRFVMSKFVP
jgi:hypothetical protein